MDLENEFELAAVNELSVFEPWRFYCICCQSKCQCKVFDFVAQLLFLLNYHRT